MFIIAGRLKGRRLHTPKGNITRPTASRLRESIFNILQNEIENASFLDIFAGSGAIGIEALSRGAKDATFIEHNKEALSCLEKNLKEMNLLPQTSLMKGDYLKMLQYLDKSGKTFDLIFADAPYHLETTHNLINWIATHPLLKPQGKLLIENDTEELPEVQSLKHLNTRRSGRAYLHQFIKF